MKGFILGFGISGIIMAAVWAAVGNSVLYVLLNLIVAVLGLGFYEVIKELEKANGGEK